jgi:hypothetical protein
VAILVCNGQDRDIGSSFDLGDEAPAMLSYSGNQGTVVVEQPAHRLHEQVGAALHLADLVD